MPIVPERAGRVALAAAMLTTAAAACLPRAEARQVEVKLLSGVCTKCSFFAELMTASKPELSHPALCISYVHPQSYLIEGRRRAGALLEGLFDTTRGARTSPVILLYPENESDWKSANGMICAQKWDEAGTVITAVQSLTVPSAGQTRGLQDIFRALFGRSDASYVAIQIERPLPAMIRFADQSTIRFPGSSEMVWGPELEGSLFLFANGTSKPYAQCKSSVRQGVRYISC